MERLTVLTITICLALAGCRERSSSRVVPVSDSADTSTQFPLSIEGGTRIVYRFGKMTPRGLKYFYDTVDVNDKPLALPDSVQVTFLSPINLDVSERENLPCVIAISVPGMWEETIFGVIDDNGILHLNYISEIELKPTTKIDFQPGNWSATFQDDAVEVRISALLSNTAVGDHLSGKGKLTVTDHGKLTEDHEVFLVYNKRKR